MSELFPIEAVTQDSPRLAWMKRHGIITLHHAPGHCPATWFAGFQSWWPTLTGDDFFCTETGKNGDSRIGQGDTENEALADLMTCWDARKVGMRLWFEEGA